MHKFRKRLFHLADGTIKSTHSQKEKEKKLL